MSCIELCEAAFYLANYGVAPISGDQIMTSNQVKYINSMLLTCGTYDAVGDFAYRVGLPGKSGVGGGIIAIMPGHFDVCVWSPGLDSSGNSLAGVAALELFTSKTGISVTFVCTKNINGNNPFFRVVGVPIRGTFRF